MVLSLLSISTGKVKDYWDEDYDDGKNCVSEKEIAELTELDLAEKQCHYSYIIDPVEAIRDCKERLASKLLFECKMTRIKKAGDLLYCKNRGQTTCCFVNHQCDQYMSDRIQEIPEQAVQFLKDKEGSLEHIRSAEGFHKCYPIDGYDATKCAEDCKNIVNDSPLAEECSKRNGFMNCCIRRDKHQCHECRYCCSLPFCTFKNENDLISHLGENDLPGISNNATSNQENTTLNALNLLYARNMMYKGVDTRCLKPDSNEDPEKWEHYDPDDFADALTQSELEKAKTVKFDKRLYNFEDPEVFDEMTGDDYKKHFMETYGFDYVSRLDHDYNTYNVSLMSPCSKRCLKAEKSKFARQCKARGGLFKCCVNTLGLETFDATRIRLSEENLISSYQSKCEPNGNAKECSLCTLTNLCTIKDKRTFAINEEYMTKDFNGIGGINVLSMKEFKRIPFKASFCLQQDFCQLKEDYYEISNYLAALEQETMCKLSGTALDANFDFELQEIFLEKEEDCLKRKSSVRICDESILENVEDTVVRNVLIDINKELMKTQNKNKKKKGKRKKKKSKKKKSKDKSSQEKKSKKKKERKKKKKKSKR